MKKIFSQIRNERERQDAIWGDQSHPSVVSNQEYVMPEESLLQEVTEHRRSCGKLSWADILLEEVSEVIHAPSEHSRREELIQVAAVCVAWVQDMDNKHG